MSAYSREEFTRHTKDQLLDYIEQQNEQLGRFEARFRDVVRAYRGVLKEKEALEKTLKALSVQQEVVVVEEEEEGEGVLQGQGAGERDGNKTPQNEEIQESDVSDGARVTEAGSASETDDGERSAAEGQSSSTTSLSPCPPKASTHTISQLKQQISTLTVAMATLTEEKSKMEVNFQQDKKAVMSQQDLLTKQLQSEKENLKRDLIQCQDSFSEIQESLRVEQKSRSEEQLTHSEMLKELQGVIASERESRDTMAAKMQEKEMLVERLQKQISEDRTREYEENLRIMSVELEQVRSRLAATEKQAHQPPPLLLQLQEDMARMREEHMKAIEAEQHRANEAEKRLHSQAEHEELRVASLESKLTELSKSVGSYDQQREADQLAIQKLKERIAQLDSENTVLTKVHLERQETLSSETSSQVAILQEKLSRMKALLKQATLKINEKTMLPSNVEELTVSDYNEMLSMEPSRKEYEQELHHMKEEFEKYKLRAQSVLKSRGSKVDSEVTNEEMKKLSRQNRELQEQLSLAQSGLEEMEERQLVRTSRHREEMRDLHDKHRQQVASMETAHKQKLQELSSQMQSTRERSLRLISEKDTEIQRLKSELLEAFHPSSSSSSSQPSTPLQQRQKNRYSRTISSGSTSSLTEQVSAIAPVSEEASRQNSLESSGEPNNDTSSVKSSLRLPLKTPSESDISTQVAVKELLEQPSPLSVSVDVGVASEERLLHRAHEKQRRREEAILARRKVFQLEDTIRDLQEREGKNMEQIGFLKEEIRKLQRDRSRETENMEYLKNIIIHFMSADSAGREQMINPIATVLHFSKEEVAQIRKSIASRRWISSGKKI